MKFSELSEEIRVKMSESGEEELWHRVDEFGGVKEFCAHFDYSESKLYNWRSKEVFYPVDFVRKLMGNEASEEVVAYKGDGRSLPVKDPVFPLPESDELLTRIDSSVHVNRKGVPVYQTGERPLVERFRELLQEIGEVPVSVYSRSVYELRYPKYLHDVLTQIDFEPEFAAMVDEKGSVEDGKLVADGTEVRAEEFEGKLYCREKRFQLAVQRGDSDVLRSLVKEEARKVSELF